MELKQFDYSLICLPSEQGCNQTLICIRYIRLVLICLLRHLLLQHMIIFTKAPQSVIGPGAAIKYPHGWSELVDYEAGVLHPSCLSIVVLGFLSFLDQSFLCLFVSCLRACSDHRQTWTQNSKGRCPGPHFWVSALVLLMDVVSEVICETWTRTCVPDKSLPRMVCPFREDCEF